MSRKYYKGMPAEEYRYKNFGFSLTSQQITQSFIEWLAFHKKDNKTLNPKIK